MELTLWDSFDPPPGHALRDALNDIMRGGLRVLERFAGDLAVEGAFGPFQAAELAALVSDAKAADPALMHGVDLTRFLDLRMRGLSRARAVAAVARHMPGVQAAVVRPRLGLPQGVTPDDAWAMQPYLRGRADDDSTWGVDAETAWQLCAGADGSGARLFILEGGWEPNHRDLDRRATHRKPLHGWNADPREVGITQHLADLRGARRRHGTMAVGVACALDNDVGFVGVAPQVELVMASYIGENEHVDEMGAALVTIGKAVGEGDVVLIEAAMDFPGSKGRAPRLPLDAMDSYRQVIRCLVAKGAIVIEPAGNQGGDDGRGRDLAVLPDCVNVPVDSLDPTRPSFFDSGAVMVAAGQASPQHGKLEESNFGARIDCFAWGQQVRTCSYAHGNPAAQGVFGGTSSASALVAGAACAIQGMSLEIRGQRLSPRTMRDLLRDRAATGPNRPSPTACAIIGAMPSLGKIPAWLRGMPGAPGSRCWST